jgi:hypothetical protein
VATGIKDMSTTGIGANVVKFAVRSRQALATRNDVFFSMSYDAIAVEGEVIVDSVNGEVYRAGLLHRSHPSLVTTHKTRVGSRGGQHFRLVSYIPVSGRLRDPELSRDGRSRTLAPLIYIESGKSERVKPTYMLSKTRCGWFEYDNGTLGDWKRRI